MQTNKLITKYSTFTDNEVLEILTPFVPNGWEVFGVQNKSLKIRKKYGPTDIQFNEDGYEYNIISIHFDKTRHYLRLIELGYTFSKDFFN